MRFSFKKGLIFCAIKDRWTLQRRLVTGKLQFESEDGELNNLTDVELHKLWLNGTWVLDIKSLGSQADVIYVATPRDLSTFPEKWQKVAQRRLYYIQAVNPEINKYNVDLWRGLAQSAAENIKDLAPPAPSSLYVWWMRYKLNKSILSLIPRKQSGITRNNNSVYVIFEEVIAKVYLTHQKKPKSEVVSVLRDHIHRLNQSRELARQIKLPASSTIYRWLNDLQQDIVDGARLGANAARVKYRTAMGGLKVDGPLSRIEIDHTPIDLIVIDKLTMLPLGRPWLTLAIDKHTRMIYSFYISFNTPSSHSILQCLKRGILPKTELLARFPDIKGDWPIYGIPTLIAVDNGMDLHSEAFEKACLELGIQLLYCPAAHPEAKGSVERFFRTLNQGLIHKLPGTVFSNIDERGDYPSEEVAAIDMETLVYLMVKWIVDVYNISVHRGIKTTPLLKWHESAPSTIIDLPVFPQQLDVITGIPATRTVFHYGIELEGLHYNSKELQQIRRHSGENLQVPLKFFMDTIAYIQVYDEKAREYIKVSCVNDEYSEGLQRDTHRLIREHARRKFNEQYSFVQLMEARHEIEIRIRDAIQHKKMANRKLGAGYLMHDSEAVFNKQNPLLHIQKPIKSATSKRPSALPAGLDDQLPKFDVFKFAFNSLSILDLANSDEAISDDKEQP